MAAYGSRASVLLAVAIAMNGCGDSTGQPDDAGGGGAGGAEGIGGEGGDGGDGGGGGSVPGVTCGANEVLLAQTIGKGATSFDGLSEPLAGVRACVASDPSIPCTTTAADGRWEVCLPASAEIALSYELDGYIPTLVGIVTGTEPSASPRASIQVLRSNDVCDSPWTTVGVACPPTTETLLFIKAVTSEPDTSESLPSGLADVSVELTPAADLGPLYEGPVGIDETATATLGSGNVFAAGLASPDQTISLSHPTLASCRGFSFDSWPGPTPGTVRVPTRPGFRSLVAVTCE